MYTKQDIIKQLFTLGAPRDGVVMVHSAYSLVGEVEGGPRGFLDALVEYFTAEGGLICIPSHTWGLLGKTDVTLDLNESYTNLGLLPKTAVLHTSGERSENPTHSTVVFGDKKRVCDFIENEKWVNTPTAPAGCYGKLYGENGYVLLIGVSQTSNTYLHAVDEILGKHERMEKTALKLKVKRVSGEEVEREMYMFDERYGDVSRRFDKFSTAFAYHGATVCGRLGDAPTILCDAVKMKEVVELIYSRAGDKDLLSDDGPISPKLYKKVKVGN